jgi:signal transduction histidine kinase
MNATKPAWLPLVLEAVPVAMIAFDGTGRVVGLNTLAERLFATSAADLRGMDTGRAAGLPAALSASVDRVLSGASDTEHGELRVGDERVVYTVGWAAGAEPVVLVNAQILARADDSADFLSLASHELRTPLTAIKGGTQLLQRRIARSGERAVSDRDVEMLAVVAGQADRLTRIVDSLLEASRLVSGRIQLVMERHSLPEVLRDAVETQRRAGENPITLDLDAEPAVATFDRQRLLQVLHELLRNAAGHSRPDQPIMVTLRVDEGATCVSVSDEGPGVPAADRPHVFERFYRGTNSDTGLGLGLYIASELVRLHRGRLWLDPAPGPGATFWLALPAA